MVDEFSHFARLPSPKAVPADLNALLSDTLAIYDGLFEGITLQRAFQTGLPLVRIDPDQIQRVVVNLVDNAVRFATRHVELRITNNPTQFFIRVWDDGPGIPDRYIPHIFDRGWTPEVAKREVKTSSGLGLFISRALAKSSGGDLTVVSVPESTPDHAPESAYLKDDAQGESQRAHRTEFLLSLPLESSR